MTRRRRTMAMMAVVVLGVAGCSPVNGAAVTASPLDVGVYPTTAVAVSVRPGIGTVLEGQRMAANVVLPTDVDNALRRLESATTGPVPDAQGLRAVIRARRAGIAQAHHFVAGFSSARSTEGEPTPAASVVNLVLRFPDSGSAAAAASEMAAAEPARPVAIGHHRESLALVVMMPRGVIVESFTPRGPYVLYQWVQIRSTLDAATGLIAGILDLQGPRIDEFTPTDPGRLAELPIDPTGLLARTLPPAVGVYSAAGALHFERDPVRAAELFAAAPVTAVALGRATVYESESVSGATLLADKLPPGGTTAADAIAGVPDAACVDLGAGPSQYGCHGTSGRYMFTTTSADLQDARQQAAAQFLMLGG